MEDDSSPPATNQSGDPSSEYWLEHLQHRLETSAEQESADRVSDKIRRFTDRRVSLKNRSIYQFLLVLDPDYSRHRRKYGYLRHFYEGRNTLIGDQLSLFSDQDELRHDFRAALLRILARDYPDLIIEAVRELIRSEQIENLDDETLRLLNSTLINILADKGIELAGPERREGTEGTDGVDAGREDSKE